MQMLKTSLALAFTIALPLALHAESKDPVPSAADIVDSARAVCTEWNAWLENLDYTQGLISRYESLYERTADKADLATLVNFRDNALPKLLKQRPNAAKVLAAMEMLGVDGDRCHL